jgi:xanthine dehydrogenase accessory factor
VKTPLYHSLREAITADRAAALATVVAGAAIGRQLLVFADGRAEGSVGSPAADEEVGRRARAFLAKGTAGRFTVAAAEGPLDVFVEVHRPRPQLILVGAVHTAIPLVIFAKELGFETIVVDPRGTFATPERFAHADRLLREWPQEALPQLSLHEETCLATLSHDPKIDLPALQEVLRKPLRYIGALGSKKTHGKRVAALEEAGFTSEEIARIHAPIGLDLGGRRPAEIALAVIAEIVAVRHGRR